MSSLSPSSTSSNRVYSNPEILDRILNHLTVSSKAKIASTSREIALNVASARYRVCKWKDYISINASGIWGEICRLAIREVLILDALLDTSDDHRPVGTGEGPFKKYRDINDRCPNVYKITYQQLYQDRICNTIFYPSRLHPLGTMENSAELDHPILFDVGRREVISDPPKDYEGLGSNTRWNNTVTVTGLGTMIKKTKGLMVREELVKQLNWLHEADRLPQDTNALIIRDLPMTLQDIGKICNLHTDHESKTRSRHRKPIEHLTAEGVFPFNSADIEAFGRIVGANLVFLSLDQRGASRNRTQTPYTLLSWNDMAVWVPAFAVKFPKLMYLRINLDASVLPSEVDLDTLESQTCTQPGNLDYLTIFYQSTPFPLPVIGIARHIARLCHSETVITIKVQNDAHREVLLYKESREIQDMVRFIWSLDPVQRGHLLRVNLANAQIYGPLDFCAATFRPNGEVVPTMTAIKLENLNMYRDVSIKLGITERQNIERASDWFPALLNAEKHLKFFGEPFESPTWPFKDQIDKEAEAAMKEELKILKAENKSKSKIIRIRRAGHVDDVNRHAELVARRAELEREKTSLEAEVQAMATKMRDLWGMLSKDDMETSVKAGLDEK